MLPLGWALIMPGVAAKSIDLDTISAQQTPELMCKRLAAADTASNLPLPLFILQHPYVFFMGLNNN